LLKRFKSWQNVMQFYWVSSSDKIVTVQKMWIFSNIAMWTSILDCCLWFIHSRLNTTITFNAFHPIVHRLTYNICLLPSNTTTLIKYPGYRMSLHYICFRLHVSGVITTWWWLLDSWNICNITTSCNQDI
jgi:hypothetical protein